MIGDGKEWQYGWGTKAANVFWNCRRVFRCCRGHPIKSCQKKPGLEYEAGLGRGGGW